MEQQVRGSMAVGSEDGTYVIRLLGDIRLNLSIPFNRFCDQMLAAEDFFAVAIDLRDATSIDSTALGSLAKLSIAVRSKTGHVPLLLCPSQNMLRILDSMGLDDVFDIVRNEDAMGHSTNLPTAEITQVGKAEKSKLRQQVIDAHQTLMSLNARNESTFKDLVEALEAEAAAEASNTDDKNALDQQSARSG